MKNRNKIISLLMLALCLPSSAIGEQVTNSSEMSLPEYVGIYSIIKEVREEVNKFPTSVSRVAYLSSIIVSNSTDASELQNSRKASAIRLLGVIASTNAIGVLISNIDFVDIKYHDNPSVETLAAIGEPAVADLLDVLKQDSATPVKWGCAVKTLMLIKKANPKIADWIEFMNAQKDKLPRDAWDRLWRYGSTL